MLLLGAGGLAPGEAAPTPPTGVLKVSHSHCQGTAIGCLHEAHLLGVLSDLFLRSGQKRVAGQGLGISSIGEEGHTFLLLVHFV